MSTGSMAFGFCLGACLPVFQTDQSGKIFADHAGGLWVVGDELVHVKDGVVTSHFELEGLQPFQSISEDPDGSLWVARRASDAPLCHVTDRAVKCFGKDDGIPISSVNSLLADGKGGFWLGGQTALVHWHGGVSETYPIGALKSSGGDIMGLALAPDGSLWVGIGEGRGSRTCTIEGWRRETVRYPQLRRKQAQRHQPDVRS